MTQGKEEKATELLLHTCCADCALKFISSSEVPSAFRPVLYFDNSNIHPRTEWLARLDAAKTVAEEHRLEIIVADWSPREWFAAIDGNSDNTKLRRCRACWKLRLKSTARKAKTLNVKFFSTTLLTSHYQNREIICEIGEELAEQELEFLSNITLNETKNTKTKGFYKQNYCGCCYSLANRYEEKYNLD